MATRQQCNSVRERKQVGEKEKKRGVKADRDKVREEDRERGNKRQVN